MKGNIEREGIDSSFPTEEPGDKDEMSCAADREEFSKTLDDAEYHCLSNQILTHLMANFVPMVVIPACRESFCKQRKILDKPE